MIRQSQPGISTDLSCILINEVREYYRRYSSNLLLLLFVDTKFYLHNPDNYLVDEFKTNLTSKENLSILRKCTI